jgi:Domain of Unknown Function (DUF1080)
MLKKLLFLIFPLTGMAQTQIALNDLSAFNNPSANWTIEGDVSGNFNATTLTAKAGKGVLLNKLKGAKYQKNDNLIFNFDHGDIKLSLDFMIPKGSNSGIYLQGRYEVQILDSWLKPQPNDGDCGAIYHRWDDARGKGNEGYEGHPPRQNATKAPGLWNHVEIDFKAPTFDASGKKLTNARFNSVILNGILIHQNVEVMGPTRASVSEQEVAKAPVMIQGDHGEVALKNIRYEVAEKGTVTFSPVNYEYFDKFGLSTPTEKGTIPLVTQKVAPVTKEMILKFNGKFNVKDADKYTFVVQWNGEGSFVVDGDTLTKGWFVTPESRTINRKLSAGEHTYNIHYSKNFAWRPNGIGITMQRERSEKQSLTERTSLPDPEPIPLVEVKATNETQCQRSFVMYGNKKKTHAINVGTPSGLNYSYDLNQGGFLQLWRGKFLNTTEMWHDRGEPQTGEPMGVAVNSNDKFLLAYLPNENAEIADSLSKNDLKYKGYKMEKRWTFSGTYNYPNFMYEYKGLKVNDISTPLDEALGINRHVKFEGESPAGANLYALIAEGSDISEVASNRYSIDNKSYYVQVFPTENNKIIVRESKGKKQLLMPLNGLKEVSYHLIF